MSAIKTTTQREIYKST